MVKKQTNTLISMDALINRGVPLPIRQLKRGDIVEGTIIEINDKEALVDVGAKSEGVIPQSEIKFKEYKVGDKVLVYVMTAEDRRGQMVLSANRAQSAKSWIDLQEAYKSGEALEIVITGHNRGGLIGDIAGMSGFVPYSHTQSAADLDMDKTELQAYLDKMKGQVLKVRIIELDLEKNRVIGSEKEATLGAQLKTRKAETAKLTVGQLVSGKVSAVMPYGLMIEFDGVEGLVPREEVSWHEDDIDEMLGSFTVGQAVDVQVLDVDQALGKVKLSLKSVSVNPWEDFARDHKVGEILDATVTRITSYGVFGNVSAGIDGMIALSSIPDDVDLTIGKAIKVEVQLIDPEKRRLDLGYKV